MWFLLCYIQNLSPFFVTQVSEYRHNGCSVVIDSNFVSWHCDQDFWSEWDK